MIKISRCLWMHLKHAWIGSIWFGFPSLRMDLCFGFPPLRMDNWFCLWFSFRSVGFLIGRSLVSVGGICHFYLRHCGRQTTFSPDHCLTVSFPARLTFGFYIGAVYIFFLRCCRRCLLLSSAVADGHSVFGHRISFWFIHFLPWLNLGFESELLSFLSSAVAEGNCFLFRSVL